MKRIIAGLGLMAVVGCSGTTPQATPTPSGQGHGEENGKATPQNTPFAPTKYSSEPQSGRFGYYESTIEYAGTEYYATAEVYWDKSRNMVLIRSAALSTETQTGYEWASSKGTWATAQVSDGCFVSQRVSWDGKLEKDPIDPTVNTFCWNREKLKWKREFSAAGQANNRSRVLLDIEIDRKNEYVG